MASKSVWVIEEGSYSDYHVVGVYSSEENARRVCALMDQKYDKPGVNEWPLDPAIDEINAGLRTYLVQMHEDGTVTECREDQVHPGHQPSFCIHSHPNKDGSLGFGDYVLLLQGWGVWAKDCEHAIKITNEKRTQMIAEGKWGLPKLGS